MFRMSKSRITRLFKQENNNQYAEETIPVFDRRFGTWLISVKRLGFSSSELTRLYNEATTEWDRTLDRLGFPDAYETMLRRVISEARLDLVGTRPRVLDCGAGTGALSSALSHVLSDPFDLDAIDISARMLEQAEKNLRDSDLEVTFRQDDVCDLPYGDGVFDLVMTAHMLEHLVDPSVALNEMIRVLKPGGLLITCISRRSTLGMMIHLKWRTHQVTPAQTESWLLESGLENVHRLSFDDNALCQHLSVACVGKKPLLPTLQTGCRCTPSTQD